MQQFDIVILGGGLVGLSLFLALPDRLRQRTVLLDAGPSPDAAHGQAPAELDDRGTALNQRSLEILQTLGVYEAIASDLGPIKHIEVSQTGYWGTTQITNPEADDSLMGAVANNRRLGFALWQRAATNAKPGSLRHDTTVDSVRIDTDNAHLTLNSGEALTAKLVILADGGRSGIAKQLGIAQREHDYAQTAFTLNLEREQLANGRAYERFSPQGPRALLPLAGRRQTLVWVTATREADSVARWDAATWTQQVTDCFGFDQGRVTALSAPAQYPLIMKTTAELARPRLALVGNGAMTLHPVAGQGFNLHLRALFDLARNLDLDDPGHSTALLAWQTRTQRENATVGRACHGLVSLFRPEHPMLGHARGLGLAGFNALPALKNTLARRAMGWS